MNKVWIWVIIIIIVLAGGYWFMNRDEEVPTTTDGTVSGESTVSETATMDAVMESVSGN